MIKIIQGFFFMNFLWYISLIAEHEICVSLLIGLFIISIQIFFYSITEEIPFCEFYYMGANYLNIQIPND